MTTIRLMTSADLRAVSLLDKLSFNQPWPPNAFEIELKNPGARCWVAEADHQVVGALVFWRVLDEAELATLAIHPGFRRRGIARMLLQTAMEAAYTEGARVYQLEVRAGNLAAQKLYESFGFSAVGRRLRYYKDNGEDAVLMTKASE
jgi:ribosomal-protein-alanine N-acetyltransferase